MLNRKWLDNSCSANVPIESVPPPPPAHTQTHISTPSASRVGSKGGCAAALCF